MPESVPVRCPVCRREHFYSAPSYPCACGAPVSPPLDRRGAPLAVTHRTWDEDWVTVRCTTCGRTGEWPHPELGCACGSVLRIAVAGAPLRPVQGRPLDAAESHPPAEPGIPSSTAADAPPGPGAAPDPGREKKARDGMNGTSASGGGRGSSTGAEPGGGTGADPSAHGPVPLDQPSRPPAPRPAFQPVAIRTARDAVTVTALYLRWLGYRDIRRADQRPPSGIGLAGRGVLAQVDPTVRPASLRDVECLWLTAMSESAGCVYFSLAGYADDARTRADDLGVPLFVLDLTGTPQPVNSPADDLVATGA